MSEEKLLDMWQSITGYVEDWETKFSEILDELESLSFIMGDEEKESDEYESFEEEVISVDSLKEDVKLVRSNLRETIKQALNGEISPIEVEEVFRSVGEFLMQVEEKILKLREAEEYEDLEEDEDYNEEDSY
ncbi:MAG: hypothetical protein ABIL49_02355 [candidate division WOR-3 bacterium]|jgi:hypothetical protein